MSIAELPIVPGWPDVLERLETAQNDPAERIGTREVGTVVNITRQLSEMDDQFGSRPTHPMAATFIVNSVAPFLRAQAPEAVHKAMLSAAADLCYLTGYMAAAERHNGLARQCYEKALELARTADDRMRRSIAIRGMSVLAVDLDDGPEAMRLADAAADVSPRVDPLMDAFLAGQQAHCAAKIGDRRSAFSHLRRAEAAMAEAGPPSRPFGSYSPSALLYHTGQVRHALGDVRGSVAALREAVRALGPGHRRTRLRFLCLLAERLLEAGELDAACATWRSALELHPHVKSGRCDERVRAVPGLLRPYRGSPVAREVLERLPRLT